MIETPQIDPRRRRRLGAAARWSPPRAGRCAAAHFGTYDYTAALRHHRRAPAHAPPGLRLRQAHDAGGARRHRRLALRRRDQRHAGAGARAPAGAALTAAQREENRAGVHAAWRLHYDDVRHSLRGRLLPGLGPAPGAAADALRRGLRVLPRGARRGRARGCRTSSTRPRRRRWWATCSTTPPPARACSTTSCAACNCGRDHRGRGACGARGSRSTSCAVGRSWRS